MNSWSSSIFQPYFNPSFIILKKVESVLVSLQLHYTDESSATIGPILLQ